MNPTVPSGRMTRSQAPPGSASSEVTLSPRLNVATVSNTSFGPARKGADSTFTLKFRGGDFGNGAITAIGVGARTAGVEGIVAGGLCREKVTVTAMTAPMAASGIICTIGAQPVRLQRSLSTRAGPGPRLAIKLST